MRFLVDESADARLATYLESQGHDARTVARDYASALDDTDVLSIASGERRTLITNDRDFGQLIFGSGQEHAGVIYLRLERTSLALKIERLNYVLTSYANQLDQFIVVDHRAVRVRPTARR